MLLAAWGWLLAVATWSALMCALVFANFLLFSIHAAQLQYRLLLSHTHSYIYIYAAVLDRRQRQWAASSRGHQEHFCLLWVSGSTLAASRTCGKPVAVASGWHKIDNG